MSSIGRNANQIYTSDSYEVILPEAKQNNDLKAVTIAGDKSNFDVRKGIVPALKDIASDMFPTLKGVGAGMVGAAIGGSLACAAVWLPQGGESIVVYYVALASTLPGAIVGAAVTNISDNKLSGAFVAATAGAISGALVGLTVMGVNYPSLLGAVTGAGIGAGAGIAAALVAEKE